MKTTDSIFHKITKPSKKIQEELDAYIATFRPKIIEEYTENGITITRYQAR